MLGRANGNRAAQSRRQDEFNRIFDELLPWNIRGETFYLLRFEVKALTVGIGKEAATCDASHASKVRIAWIRN